jgi:hypothetical protein
VIHTGRLWGISIRQLHPGNPSAGGAALFSFVRRKGVVPAAEPVDFERVMLNASTARPQTTATAMAHFHAGLGLRKDPLG